MIGPSSQAEHIDQKHREQKHRNISSSVNPEFLVSMINMISKLSLNSFLFIHVLKGPFDTLLLLFGGQLKGTWGRCLEGRLKDF